MKPNPATLAATVKQALGKRIDSSRQDEVPRLAEEFFGAYAMAKISFRPARDIAKDRDAAADAASKAAALRTSLRNMTPYGRKSVTYVMREFENSECDEVTRLLRSLSDELNRLNAEWKKESKRHRSEEVFAKLLANWTIIFYERLTGERATATNARGLNEAIFDLFKADVEGRSPAKCLQRTIESLRKHQARWAARRAA